MKDKKIRGYTAASFTILIWGTTFISTKILLEGMQPVEILFLRFVIGFLLLLAISPKRLKGISRRQEIVFLMAGFC